MTMPIYKLKSEHAASIGHVRELYAKVVNEFATLENTYPKTYVDEQLGLMLKKDGTRLVTNTLQYTTEPVLANRTDIPNLGYTLDQLDLKSDKITTYTKTETDTALVLKANQATTYTKTETDTFLTGKKNTGTFDTKIQNSTGLTAISCDTDRYMSLKSNGTKLCDILEDEQNAGMTILTNKRFNVVSTQPQTLYHNSPAGLFNFKYTDDGNQVTGQARFGQIQLAPSNTTNLNPALTFSSSRVNGLGTAGAIFLDSTYGSSANPLIISPQSLTDAGGNQFSMLRSTASLPAGTLRNTFTGVTGSTAVVSAPQQFATKTYVDSAVSGLVIPDPDLTPYLPKSGGTMTGDLFLNELYPTEDLQASTKKYVDDKANQITTLVDKNQTDGNYKLEIDSNRVNFYRGDGTDKYLEIFGSTSETNGTVTLSSKRDIMRLPTLGTTLDRSEWQFGCGTELANGSPYTSNALFRILGGNSQGQAYTQLVSSKLNANGTPDGTNTSIIMYPRQEGTALRGNFIEFRDGAGYTSDADYGTQDGLSILSRAQNDDRYEFKGEGNGGGSSDRLISADEPSVKVIASSSNVDIQVNDSSVLQFSSTAVDTIIEGKKEFLYLKTPTANASSNVLISSDDASMPYAQIFSALGTQPTERNIGLLCYDKGEQLAPNIMRIYTRDDFHQENDGQAVTFEVNRPIGYKSDYGASFTAFETDNSILPRSKNDDRYERKNQVQKLKYLDGELALTQSGSQTSARFQYIAPDETTKEYCRISQQIAEQVTSIQTNPLLRLVNNSLSDEYQVDICSGLNELKLATKGNSQEAYIQFEETEMRFKDDLNNIQFNQRIGYNGPISQIPNDHSFLSQSEIVSLIQQGASGLDYSVFTAQLILGEIITSIQNPPTGTAITVHRQGPVTNWVHSARAYKQPNRQDVARIVLMFNMNVVPATGQYQTYVNVVNFSSNSSGGGNVTQQSSDGTLHTFSLNFIDSTEIWSVQMIEERQKGLSMYVRDSSGTASSTGFTNSVCVNLMIVVRNTI